MIDLPESMKKEVLADWIEAICLFGKDEFVSDVVIERFLDEQEIEPEEKVLDIRSEIDLRHFMGRESHPVVSTLDGFQRIQEWTNNLAYSFQLLLALKDQYETTKVTGSRWNFTAKLFERMVTLALKEYLKGEAINVGYPRVHEIRSFSKCIDHLCDQLNEERGEKRMQKKNTKDDLVDVVAWRSFGDKRSGQFVILAGCAAGKDWRDKVSEIKEGQGYWKLHIRWKVEPITAFAFPYVCFDTPDWERLSQVGGVPLDRLRITFMFMSLGNSDLGTELKKWCEEQLPRLPWLE